MELLINHTANYINNAVRTVSAGQTHVAIDVVVHVGIDNSAHAVLIAPAVAPNDAEIYMARCCLKK
jgi:hypothetical protein